MSEYDNQFSLWKNDRKVEGDNRPEWSGSGKISGMECWVAAWVKTNTKGEKYFSVAFNDKNDKEREGHFLLFKAREDAKHAYQTAKDNFDFEGDIYRAEASNKKTSNGVCCEVTIIPLNDMDQTAGQPEYQEEAADSELPF